MTLSRQEERARQKCAVRLEELDSLRGLAALCVVFYHFKLLLNEDALTGMASILYRGPLRLFTAGHEAVILFFILSGFVLSIPAIRAKAQAYPVFVTRRIFRIYFPYIVALALAVSGAATLHTNIPGNAWFHRTWSHPVEWHLVLAHGLFIGQYDTAEFNTAFWSIVVEMRISLVFPALCAFALWLKPAKSLGFAMVLSLGSYLLLHGVPQRHFILAGTTHYAGMFVVGIYLARQQRQMSQLYTSFSRPAKIAVAILCVILFVYSGHFFHALMLKRGGTSFILQSDWLTSLGGAGLILFSLNSESCRRMLLLRPVRFLGQLSYSMYLLHGTVLFALMHLLCGHLTLIAILPLYLVTVMVSSAIFYRFIERPSMEWGRRISDRLPQFTADPLHALLGPAGVVSE
jgi:peptidoglycan/LPS O-acetylase OafA/YrhL